MPGLLLVLVTALLVPRQALAQKMYWIDVGADKIQRADLDGTNVEDLITTGLTGARFIEIDSAGGKMYWADAGKDKIMRANLDGTGAEDLVTGLNNARDIELDVSGGKMYWTDKGTLKIQRANLDGTGVEDLLNTGVGSDPRGLALDIAGGKMYWTDRLFDKIQRANLDGTGVEDLVTSGMANSQDMALDVAGGKMYWTDKGSGDVIKRANMDGSSVETLASGLNNPFGIALDVSGGKMYWCSEGANKVQRANLDGSSVEDLVTTGLTDPTGIALDLGGGGPTLTLADHDPPGQETDAFSDGGGESDAELFAFKLDPGPDTISVTELVFSLSNIANLADLDWVLPELVEDADGDGAISGSEASTGVVGGGGTVSGSTITFSSSISVSSAMNYILRADFPTLANCAKVTIALTAANVDTTATVTGSTTSASHVEGTGCGGGGGGSFTWLTAASDISLGTTGSWQDIDLSAFVPAGATGAVVEIANTSSGNVYRAVVRGKEDTRDYMSTASWNAISELVHRYQIVKIDSNRFIQGYINNTSVDFRLLGYTSGSDPSYFALPADITPGTFGSWTTVNVSSEVDADADGVILFIQNQDSANRVYGVRELTSGDITLDMRNERSRMHVVGLDASKEFQAYIQTTAVKIYLVAQTKGSVVYYTNNVAVTDPTTGSWQTLDADNYSVADEANGLFLSVWNSGSVNDMSFRHGDSTDDFSQKKLNGNKGFQAPVGLNALNEWGEYMGNTGLDVSIAAYTKDSGGGNWMATGTYTGDGTAGNAITGVGFQPDAVIVKMYPNRKAQMRTSTMTGDATKELQSALSLGTNRIQSLDTDGFTLGSNVSVNESGNPFHWIAFKDTAGVCKVGTYTGDGVNNRSIAGVGFQPDYVIVASAGAHNAMHRSSSITGDTSLRFDATGVQTGMIKALEADGFQVGSDAHVNGSGTVYHYVAFKAAAGTMAVGTYAGDGVDNRSITVGFQPKWVIVDTSASVDWGDGSPGSVHRPDTMSGDVSINFSWAYGTTTWANCIQAIQSDGFQVGNNVVVNQSATTYYWMAFKTGTGGSPPPKPKIIKWVEVDPYRP